MMPGSKAFRLAGKYSIFPWTLASIVSHHPSHATVNQVLHSSFENFLGEALSLQDKISQDRVYTFLIEIWPRVSEANKVHLTFLKVGLHLQTFHSQMKGIRETFSTTTVTKKGEVSMVEKREHETLQECSKRHTQKADSYKAHTTAHQTWAGWYLCSQQTIKHNLPRALSLWNQEGAQTLACVRFPKLHISIK